jgi:hypothetical protein
MHIYYVLSIVDCSRNRSLNILRDQFMRIHVQMCEYMPQVSTSSSRHLFQEDTEASIPQDHMYYFSK